MDSYSFLSLPTHDTLWNRDIIQPSQLSASEILISRTCAYSKIVMGIAEIAGGIWQLVIRTLSDFFFLSGLKRTTFFKTGKLCWASDSTQVLSGSTIRDSQLLTSWHGIVIYKVYSLKTAISSKNNYQKSHNVLCKFMILSPVHS